MSQPQAHKHSESGFTLLEMLITLTVVGILVSVAMPDMSGFSAKQKLIGAAEQVYGHIQQARSEAISSSVPAQVSFSVDGTTTWQYGINTRSTTLACNPTITDITNANACIIVVDDGDGIVDDIDGPDIDLLPDVDTGDRVLMRFTNAPEYTGNNSVEMNISGLGGGTQFEFDSVRGTLTSAAGQVDLVSTTGLQLRVEASPLGRISICSPDGSVPNYRTC